MTKKSNTREKACEIDESVISPLKQISSFLNQNKETHFNYQESEDYVVSSGSLVLDIEMNGGIRPGIVRSSGVSEGGKTSNALGFAMNFQKSVPNSMVVYIKSEGRLSKEMVARAGIDTDAEKWFEFKTNIYETAISLIRELVFNNPSNRKYMFIIDSIDALVPKADMDRSFEEANRVAGGALLSSDFLRKMALGLSSKSHICIVVSQVRSKVSINPYEKTDPKLTNASGGNALLHYSDWIMEFQPRFTKEMITKEINKKEVIIGHYCKLIFRKTPNEKTNREVKYPIKYGRKGGESIWIEFEVADLMIEWEMAKKAGAWIKIDDSVVSELKANNLDMPQQIQGIDNLRAFLEDNPDVTKFMYNKLKEFCSAKT